MKVFLDTNILVSDFSFSNPQIQTLLNELEVTGHSLFISRLVYEELVNKYEEIYEKQKRQSGKLHFQKIGIFPSSFDLPESTEAKEIFDQHVQTVLLTKAELVDYPNVGHKELVERALRREKPFRESDTGGYRDTLLWYSIVETLSAEENSDPVALVTKNIKDFADNEDENKLDIALIKHLEQLGLETKVELFTSLSKFVDQEIKPRLQVIDGIKTQLTEGSHHAINLEDFLQEDLVTYLGYKEWNPGDLGLNPNWDLSHVVGIPTVMFVDAIDVRKLRDNDVLISFEAEVEAEIETFIEKYEYYEMDQRREPHVYIADPDYNKYYVLAV